MTTVRSKAVGDITRLLMLTDLHFGARNNSDQHNQDTLDYLDWFLSVAEEERPSHVAFLGDFFENRNQINIRTLNFAVEGCRKLDSLGVPVIFLVGNHDLYLRGSRGIFSTEMFRDLRNFHIVNEPTELSRDWYASPYLFREEYPGLAGDINAHRYVLGHFEFRDFVVTGSDRRMDHGPSAEGFCGPQRIFSGHYHKRQWAGNVVYIGNSFPTNYGDAGDSERGCAVFDVASDDVRFHNWDAAPLFFKTRLSRILGGEADFPARSRVRCTLDVEVGYSEVQALREEMVTSLGLREFSVEEDHDARRGQLVAGQDVDDLDDRPLDETVTQLIEEGVTPSPQVSPAELVALYRELSDGPAAERSASGTALVFESLEWRNFMSYGQQMQRLDFAALGTVNIVGVNLDKGGSNGAGKTSIINALCYAIYNKPFDKINLNRLLNTTNALRDTLMEVRLAFRKGDDQYEIYRSRGQEIQVRVTRNGADITPGKGPSEVDAIIVDIIGMSYDLFINTIIFAGSSQPFLEQPVGYQRPLIEDLFRIMVLSEKADLLRKRIQTTETDVGVAEALVGQQQAALDLHNRHVRDAEARAKKWQATRDADVAEIERTLARVAEVDFEAEQALHDEKAALSERGAYLGAKIVPMRKDGAALAARIKELGKHKGHLEDSRCPFCEQAFADAPSKLEAIVAEEAEKGEKLVTLTEALKSLVAEEDAVQSRLTEVSGSISHADLAELVQARTNSAMLRMRLDELRDASNPHVEALEALVEEGCPEPDTTSVDALRRRLAHQQFLLKLLTDKNSFIRQRIISRTTPFLNGRLSHYTNRLGLPHIVRFDADMSCAVSEFGRELDWGNLSRGEKRRVSIAMSLAFRDVLHHLHARSNVLMIDEMDGGSMDDVGMDSIVKTLKEKSREEGMSVFVISHSPQVAGRLDHELRIIKEGGFSSIHME